MKEGKRCTNTTEKNRDGKKEKIKINTGIKKARRKQRKSSKQRIKNTLRECRRKRTKENRILSEKEMVMR
jgi:hypothetical protein